MEQPDNHNNKPFNVLIAGGRSKTAEAIARTLKSETSWNITLLSSGILKEDHADRVSLYPTDYSGSKETKEIFMRELPDIIINTAAITNVYDCEENRKTAWHANVQWVEFLVRMSKITDARLLHFSTDYIFDGSRGPYSEHDAPNPVNYYGKTKLAGENACRTSNVPCAILRTNVVYGYSTYGHADFVQWTVGKLQEGKIFRVVNDQFSNPTLTDDLGLAAYRIILKKREGIYNIGGGDWLSRYEFARKIADVFQFDPGLIVPCTSADLQQKARRPLKTGLITLKAETDLGVKPTGVEAGLITLRRQMQSFNPPAGRR